VRSDPGGTTRVRERDGRTLAERLAIGWRTAAIGIRRDFAATLIFVPISLVAYALGAPSLVGDTLGGLAACLGSGRLSRWLLTHIQLSRARRDRSS
jgi:hypothetical protein